VNDPARLRLSSWSRLAGLLAAAALACVATAAAAAATEQPRHHRAHLPRAHHHAAHGLVRAHAVHPGRHARPGHARHGVARGTPAQREHP
jgi:hypothetical protein